MVRRPPVISSANPLSAPSCWDRVRGRAAAPVRERITGEYNRHRDGDRKDQHQLGRDADHHEEGSQHRDNAGEHLHQVVGEGGADGVDIIGEHAEDIADGMGVKKAHGQLHQVVVNVPAQPVDDVAAQAAPAARRAA